MAVAVITSFTQQSDSNGVPLNAGTVTVYAAGTTTPLSLFSNSGLSVAATNPITLDSSGRHDMTYIATASYKILVKNSAGTTIYTRDNIDPGVAVGSGALPVANGGTAGTTAAAARTNLSAASSSDMSTAQSDITNLQTWDGYNLTTRTRVASGTTAQQPAAGTVGIRYNSTTGKVEFDNGSAWANIPRAGDIDQSYFATSSMTLLLQRSVTTLSSTTSGTTQTPMDGTIPQVGEGIAITSVNFTPVNANSTLYVFAQVAFGAATTNIVIFHLHKDGAADAVGAATWQFVNDTNNPNFTWQGLLYSESATNLAARQFALRGGMDDAGTLYINTDASSRTLGGLRKSYLIVEEWLTK